MKHEREGFRLFRQSYRDNSGKLRQAAKWRIEFRDHLAALRRLALFTDKDASAEARGRSSDLSPGAWPGSRRVSS